MVTSKEEGRETLVPDFPDDPFSEPSTSSPYLQRNDDMTASLSNDSLAAWAKTTRFNVLNHFSQVTREARNGAHNLLSTPFFQALDPGLNGSDRDGIATYQRTSVASLATSFLQHGPVGPFGPSDPTWKHSYLAKKSGTGEYDSARIYLAKWAKQVAEEGEANRRKEREESRKRRDARHTAIEESELGAFEIWDLIPCIDRPESTRVKDSSIGQEAWSGFFDDKGQPTVSLNHMRQLVFQHGIGVDIPRKSSSRKWEDLGPRAECWSFLLGAQQWSRKKDAAERTQYWDERMAEYTGLISELVEGETANTEAFWKEQRHRIRVDCLRVDKKLPLFKEPPKTTPSEKEPADEQVAPVQEHVERLQNVLLSYVIWDRKEEQKTTHALPEASDSSEGELGLLGGYVQGMSDLCAPLYSLCNGDEAKTFWLFVGLMRRIRSNFYTDQSGMKMQLSSLQKLIATMDPTLHSHLEKADSLNLFFCFRWLLICFKREFEYPGILELWEAIFCASFEDDDDTDQDESSRQSLSSSTPYKGISNHFQLFIAFAILEHHRDIILKYLSNFDELLQVSAF